MISPARSNMSPTVSLAASIILPIDPVASSKTMMRAFPCMPGPAAAERIWASRCFLMGSTSPFIRLSVNFNAASCTLALSTTSLTISCSSVSHTSRRFLFSNPHSAFRDSSLSPPLRMPSSSGPGIPYRSVTSDCISTIDHEPFSPCRAVRPLIWISSDSVSATKVWMMWIPPCCCTVSSMHWKSVPRPNGLVASVMASIWAARILTIWSFSSG
mmetsp:Transcript_63087/g.148586  ORF Transcript_63087/g.148586 Transcript_63087/m.148586 type:complete len:214 (-) Transcript_63087:4195-4836(-)